MENGKKMLYAALIVLFLSFSFSTKSYAYSEPENAYYRIVDTTEIGEVKIFFPYNLGRYFTESTSGGIISSYSNTVSTWRLNYDKTNYYDVRFPFLDVPEYRVNNYNYVDLTITDIIETNLPLLSSTDFTLFSQGTMVNMIMLFVGGSILLFTMLKR